MRTLKTMINAARVAAAVGGLIAAGCFTEMGMYPAALACMVLPAWFIAAQSMA